MGARTLRARLTRRFVAIAAGALTLVAIAAVLVTRVALDRADTAQARQRADALRGLLERELEEGDSVLEASGEVHAAAKAEGVLVSVTAHQAHLVGEAPMTVDPGECDTTDDGAWRVCSTTATSDGNMVVGALSIVGHRAAVRALGEGMLAVLALALLALWLAMRQALNEPLEEVAALVRWARASARGEPPVTDTTELAELAEAFRSLVTELVRTAESERATAAHIAHELRTPLTALLAEFDTAPRDDARVHLSREARGEVLRLAEVVDAILVVSDRNARRPDALVNVADVAREAAGAMAVEAPDEALVPGDERLLGLAMRNLVENAARHGGGATKVRVAREGDSVRVSVLDEGPGVDDDARARMFDRYWRGVADGAGKGLGLALVRAVAELHGGAADARPRDRGLDVGFTLTGVVRWQESGPR